MPDETAVELRRLTPAECAMAPWSVDFLKCYTPAMRSKVEALHEKRGHVPILLDRAPGGGLDITHHRLLVPEDTTMGHLQLRIRRQWKAPDGSAALNFMLHNGQLLSPTQRMSAIYERHKHPVTGMLHVVFDEEICFG